MMAVHRRGAALDRLEDLRRILALREPLARAKRLDQLTDNLAAIELKLTPDELRQLDGVSALPPEYPGWMIAAQGTDRTDPSQAPF